MLKQSLSALRLRRAASSVVERLEDRRLMAVDAAAVTAMPFRLDYNQSATGTMLDRDGQGTGFTHVQVNQAGNEYAPAMIDLDTATGRLRITASAGNNYDGNNALRNALETKFDATAAGTFSIGVRLLGPLTNFDVRGNQAGVSFGPDQDNYIKLVAVNVGGKQYVQFIDEQKVGNAFVHSVAAASSHTNVGNLATMESLDLVLHGDAATGRVSAYHSANGGPLTKIAYDITLTGRQKAAFFSDAATAGLAVAKRGGNAADFTATFDHFEVYAGTPTVTPAPGGGATPPPTQPPPAVVRPTVAQVTPAAGAINVSTTAKVVATLDLPAAGQSVNPATLTAANVGLFRASDNAPVPASLSLSADGTIVLQPATPLSPNTSYTFVVTDGLTDTAGTAFMPFSATFTTREVGVAVAVNKATFHFNDVRLTSGTNVPGPFQTLKIANDGSEALTIPANGIALGGADAGQFVLLDRPTTAVTVLPGQSLNLRVAMNATSLGLKVATVSVASNDPVQPVLTVALHGLGTAGTGGNNEPSLQALLNLYDIPVNTGDSNAATTLLFSPTEPLGASDEVLGMQRLTKAGSGPVTITPLAVMGVATNPAMYFGYYETAGANAKTRLFTVPTADAQSVNPSINGVTTFDPGDRSFGLYSTWPNFKAANGVDLRDVFSEDALNAGWDAANPHKYRFYQMKNPDGSVVANSYVVAVEEFTTNTDANDVVFIISNVRAAAAGPEIAFENMAGVGFSNHLAFHRINNPNATIGDVVHDTATLRIRNTGADVLNLGSISISTGWIVRNAPTGASATIAPGGFYDLEVKLVATNVGPRTGTLTVRSNDADEAAVVVKLTGFIQHESENGREPNLQAIINLFGYTTKALNDGETFTGAEAGKTKALGDEVLSGYWTRADAHQAVQVRQLAAFHTQGNTAPIAWYAKGSTAASTVLVHDRNEGQSILPHKSGTNRTVAGLGTFNTSGVFGFKIDGEHSDDTMNTQLKPGGDYGHSVRFYVAKDQGGKVIPNTYIVAMDYSSALPAPNYDFQDNLYLISNIKPAAPAAPTGESAIFGNNGVTLDWNDNAPTNLAGYNVYRSAAVDGPYAKLNGAALTASQFVDATAPQGAASYYRIVAIDTFGTESLPTPVTATPPAAPTAPAMPTGLMVTSSVNGITIDWADNVEPSLAGYNVSFSTDANAGFTRLNESLLTGSFYTHSTAPAGTTSYYRVTAVGIDGLESDFASGSGMRL